MFTKSEEKDIWAIYEEALKHHDWTFQYSDDHRVWTRGMDQQHRIRDLKNLTDELDKDRSQKLYWKHSFWFNEDGTRKEF